VQCASQIEWCPDETILWGRAHVDHHFFNRHMALGDAAPATRRLQRGRVAGGSIGAEQVRCCFLLWVWGKVLYGRKKSAGVDKFEAQNGYGFSMLLGYGHPNWSFLSSALLCKFQCSWAWIVPVQVPIPNRPRCGPYFLSNHMLYLTSQSTKLCDV